eukprot:evm.model.scf_615.1 EVM.evm.TU.scf_615.1   scf_615:7536-9623(+)
MKKFLAANTRSTKEQECSETQVQELHPRPAMAAGAKITARYIPEDHKEVAELSDAVLVLKNERLPVNSGILSMQSRVFCRLIVDTKNDRKAQADGKLAISLDASVTLEDAVLMLSFVYGKRTDMNTAEEAYRMIVLAGKYDIPNLMRISIAKIRDLAPGLHFVAPGHGDKHMEAVRWLAVADRLDAMDDLRTECLYNILRDLVLSSRPSSSEEIQSALKSLDSHGVTASAIGGVAAALAEWGRDLYESSRNRSADDMAEVLSTSKSYFCGLLTTARAVRSPPPSLIKSSLPVSLALFAAATAI